MITIVVSLLRSGERWQIEKPSVQTVIQNAGKRHWDQKTLKKSYYYFNFKMTGLTFGKRRPETDQLQLGYFASTS